LFDFYKINGKDVTIVKVADQASLLKSVVAKVQKISPSANIHIIAHSMGCIVASMSELMIGGKVILLAPPEKFGKSMEEYFSNYPGSTKENDVIVIPRKDGTTTHIPQEFFAETKHIDAEQSILDYCKVHKVNLLQTTKDEVIGQTSYELLQPNPCIEITPMNADHNFTGDHRAELISYIHKTLGLQANSYS